LAHANLISSYFFTNSNVVTDFPFLILINYSSFFKLRLVLVANGPYVAPFLMV